jgi:hypothetical protein
MILHRLQTSFFTRWLWQEYRHRWTGHVVLVPLWKDPPSQDYFSTHWPW